MMFKNRITQAWQHSDSLLCVGLDPIAGCVPQSFLSQAHPLLAFTQQVVNETAPFACAYKFQFAFFAAQGAEEELREAIAWVRTNHPHKLILLDAKRGDIGSTAEAYAAETFDRYDADVVTVNPYLGRDGIRPFLLRPERAAAVLCRNSNPSAAQLQGLTVLCPEPMPLYEKVARDAIADNDQQNLMLVMGATAPEAIAAVRRMDANVPLLIPGIGAQGGSLEDVLRAGLSPDGTGLLISASRSILFSDNRAQAARQLREDINALRRAIQS